MPGYVAALLEAEGFVAGFDDMAMMRQPIQPSSAVVSLASMNTLLHSEKLRLVVMITPLY